MDYKAELTSVFYTSLNYMPIDKIREHSVLHKVFKSQLIEITNGLCKFGV
jgi:hypothetical protein